MILKGLKTIETGQKFLQGYFLFDKEYVYHIDTRQKFKIIQKKEPYNEAILIDNNVSESYIEKLTLEGFKDKATIEIFPHDDNVYFSY